MASLNKVILLGNLGRDPEVRTTGNGSRVVSFSMATTETWTKDGERQEKTQWHRIVIWNDRLGEIAEKYLKKGSRCLLEGAIETRKFTDKDGNERETTEIVLGQFKSTLVLIDRAESDGGERVGNTSYTRRTEPPARGATQGSKGGQRSSATGPKWDVPQGGDLDDEIPF